MGEGGDCHGELTEGCYSQKDSQGLSGWGARQAEGDIRRDVRKS